MVILAVEFLKEAKPFAEEGVHPQIIIRAYRKACELVCISNMYICILLTHIQAKNKIKELSINIDVTDKAYVTLFPYSGSC